MESSYDRISQKLFFKESQFIFRQKNIETLSTSKDFSEYMDAYIVPINIKKNDFIEKDILLERLKLIWHAVSSLQIEIAYCLLYLEDAKQGQDEETKIKSNALCLHHLSLSWECLYRVWERIAQVLSLLHYKHLPQNSLYFTNIVNKLSHSGMYDQEVIKELKKHNKIWNNISKKRNNYSHNEIRLFQFSFEFSKILTQQGSPAWHQEKPIDLNQECNVLIDKFKHLQKLNTSFRNFMEKFPSSVIEKI